MRNSSSETRLKLTKESHRSWTKEKESSAPLADNKKENEGFLWTQQISIFMRYFSGVTYSQKRTRSTGRRGHMRFPFYGYCKIWDPNAKTSPPPFCLWMLATEGNLQHLRLTRDERPFFRLENTTITSFVLTHCTLVERIYWESIRNSCKNQQTVCCE